MFRKYNKKIITVVLVVVVTIGLIGPGVLLIFGSFEEADYSPRDAQIVSPQENQNPNSDVSTQINSSTSSREVAN